MTTDRELLIFIRSQIDDQLKTWPGIPEPSPETPDDELVIIPPPAHFKPPKGNFDGWVWAIPKWCGETPKESDGFNRHKVPGKRQHLGSDLCYRNSEKMRRDLPEVAPWYHCPSDTIPMLAMGPGTIWFAGKTSMGWTVKIDHGDSVGFPLVTYYTHLSELFIPEHAEGPGGREVEAGHQLGFVGNSPKGDDLNHAHIEMWDYSAGAGGSRENRCLDPGKFLRCFGQVVLGS